MTQQEFISQMTWKAREFRNRASVANDHELSEKDAPKYVCIAKIYEAARTIALNSLNSEVKENIKHYTDELQREYDNRQDISKFISIEDLRFHTWIINDYKNSIQ